MIRQAKMEGGEKSGSSGGGAHVVIFPCPAQGHVNCMLKLCELLTLWDLHVTFLNTEYVHNRLMRFGDIQSLLSCYPKLQFKIISDGFSLEHHPGFGDRIGEVINSINSNAKPLLREIIDELAFQSNGKPRVTCIIADGIFGSITTELAHEVGIPLIHFRTISACCFWAYFCAPNLFQCNELPIRGEEDLDRIITNIPGMENLLRCRDLPSFFRPSPEPYITIDSIVYQTRQTVGAHAHIFNTLDDLEAPVLSQMRLHFPKLFTIGPLHHHLNLRKKALSAPKPKSFTSSLFQEDRTCMTWLDAQPENSVIYVSFGSCTVMTRKDLMEIWQGLVNSKKRFLWVMRKDMVTGTNGDDDRIPAELEEGTRKRGFIVGWAPQEEVLAHWAVGGFLTHSGWNSTLESIAAGVPMICWPFFADQQINSRFVSEIWKVGLDMKDVCDRKVVEDMVDDVMVRRRDEFLRSAKEMAMLADKSVRHGGGSYSNLEGLVQYIKSTAQDNR